MLSVAVYPPFVIGDISGTHEAVEDQCLRACQAAAPAARTAKGC
jgi:hypothetical protein